MNVLFLMLFFTSFFILIGYWIWFNHRFAKIHPGLNEHETNTPPVSVIICYKNAGLNIFETIQAILQQEYSDFEVIAMDDFSTDEGPALLKDIKDHRLKTCKATTDKPGKKTALTEAIQLAKNEILLFTDADCIPAGTKWILTMVRHLLNNDSTDIVLGYGPMLKEKSWLSFFSRYETLLTAMQFFSYATAGKPYMGVGRNLMYRKSLFYRAGGFESHNGIISGDDDLLISSAANSLNTAVCIDPNSFMYSKSQSTWSKFMHQKSRHISTSVHYKAFHQIALTIFATSQMLFFVSGVVCLLGGFICVSDFLMLWAIKWGIQMVLHKNIFEKLFGNDLKPWFPFLDIGMMLYYFLLPCYSLFRKKAW